MFERTLDAKPTKLNSHAGEMLFAAAVKRTMDPGTKYDYTIVLIGGQGKGKSTFCSELVPNFEWFSDSADISLSTKDIVDSIHGALIVEFSEVRTKYADLARMKGFLTRRFDTIRLSYRRNAERIQRQWVALATANDSGTGILPRDLTGNRRFITIQIGEKASYDMVVDYLEEHRDQLWAEALSRYREIPIFLDKTLTEEQSDINDGFSHKDETMERAIERLREKKAQPELLEANLLDLMVEAELANDIVQAGKDKGHQNQFSEYLKDRGWISERRRKNGERPYVWIAPPDFFLGVEEEQEKLFD